MKLEDVYEKANRIYELVTALKSTIQTELPDCRERSLALTRLDECRLWAEDVLSNAVMWQSIGNAQNGGSEKPTTAAEFLSTLLGKGEDDG